MVNVLVGGSTVPICINNYCRTNNLRLIKYEGKIKIDDRMAHMFTFANKARVENMVTKNEEVYLFSGTKAKCHGFLLLDVRKVQ